MSPIGPIVFSKSCRPGKKTWFREKRVWSLDVVWAKRRKARYTCTKMKYSTWKFVSNCSKIKPTIYKTCFDLKIMGAIWKKHERAAWKGSWAPLDYYVLYLDLYIILGLSDLYNIIFTISGRIYYTNLMFLENRFFQKKRSVLPP